VPLIELIDVSKDYDGDPVFSGLSLAVEEGEKIGLVGRNGSGKTSLVRILAGLDEDFRGVARRRDGLQAALVPQRFEPPIGESCVDLMLARALRAREGLARLEEEMSSGGGEATLQEYGELRSRYDELGGDSAEEGARRTLDRAGLGRVADSPAASLSGGEKNFLALAVALSGAPELILLDEPGNHLDFAGLERLQDFIKGERRAVLMVSHNRSLLDATVSRIVEIESGRAREYAGGYSAYKLEKLKRAAGQGKDWQADRKRVERLEALVRRFAEIAASRPDPAWGKRLRARRSQLERERERAAERPSADAARMKVEFGSRETKADYALIVRGYRKLFGARVLFEGAGFDLMAGERAAIIGPNGCGKTSFLRDLVAAEGKWDEGGPIRVGPSMKVGYCAQEQEVFEGERTVGEEFEALGARRDEAGKLLRRYLFDRSILEQRVSSLSGGERNRLQIARAVLLGANFLVLDEPTNHLDIDSREALEEALADFGGTALIVSHDRWFLEKAADRLILVEGGLFVPYEGSFAEYWRDVGRRDLARDAADAARDRGGARCDRGRLAELESRITSLEKSKEELERRSSAAAAARDFRSAGRAAEEAAEAARILDRLYAEWDRAGG
jgi:ATP-binding cassette, subfamily F, member 3